MAAFRKPRKPVDWLSLRKRLAAAIEATEQASPSLQVARQLVRQRIRSLAASKPDDPTEDATLELLSFGLSGASYAIETKYICEVAVVRNLSPVPRTPGYLLGIHDVRGELLPLFDLRPLLGLPAAAPLGKVHAIICGEGSAAFGIFADEPSSIERLSPQEIKEPDQRGGDTPSSWIRGSLADRVTVLDGAALLREPRFFLA